MLFLHSGNKQMCYLKNYIDLWQNLFWALNIKCARNRHNVVKIELKYPLIVQFQVKIKGFCFTLALTSCLFPAKISERLLFVMQLNKN